jgi:hypothetical protein
MSASWSPTNNCNCRTLIGNLFHRRRTCCARSQPEVFTICDSTKSSTREFQSICSVLLIDVSGKGPGDYEPFDHIPS